MWTFRIGIHFMQANELFGAHRHYRNDAEIDFEHTMLPVQFILTNEVSKVFEGAAFDMRLKVLVLLLTGKYCQKEMQFSSLFFFLCTCSHRLAI